MIDSTLWIAVTSSEIICVVIARPSNVRYRLCMID